MTNPADFQNRTKLVLAHRAGLRCSNPLCGKLTAGPNTESSTSINIGVAAHITAASPRGPRYSQELSIEQRKSANNGIWLCQSCAKLIDSDIFQHTVASLRDWKERREELTKLEIHGGTTFHLGRTEVSAEQYSGILLPDFSGTLHYKTRNRAGWLSDYSVYPFLVEELISMGVTRIGVVAGTDAELAISLLSKIGLRRIVLIDPSIQADRLEGMFAPIACELNAKPIWSRLPQVGVQWTGDFGEDRALSMRSCAHLYPELFSVLLGIDHGMAIDANLTGARRSLAHLRRRLRSREARDVVAVFSAILSAYRSTTIDTIELSARSLPNSETFRELMSAKSYLRLGLAAHDFGYNERAKAAKADMSMAAQSLLALKHFRESMGAASELIQLPIKRAEMQSAHLSHVTEQTFLPPILNFENAKKRALRTWQRLKPEPFLGKNGSEKETIPKNVRRIMR